MKINVFLVFCDHIDIRFLQSSCISHLPNALSEHVVHHIVVSLQNITLSAIRRVAVLLVNLLILVVVALVGIRLDGEGEEVEASLVADEQGAGTVPAVARVCHLMRAKGIIIISQKNKMMVKEMILILKRKQIPHSVFEKDPRLSNP